ncbi:MAG: DNA repair protein RecO [Elusimicrobia bacterium]|nr:DNA repair protein RecO [Elusimicrobiota bacterium]
MESLLSRGLVLRRVRHLDNDLRLTLFLRDVGKVLAISKGGQRMASKLKAVQQPFVEADFHLFLPPHGVHGRLASGRLISSHERLSSHLDAFQMACRCAETVEMLLPFRAPSPEVYDILRQSFQALQGSLNLELSPHRQWVLFVVRLLKVLGHGDMSDQASELLSRAPLDQCVTFVEGELSRVLPWRLKSDVEVV